MNTQSKVTVIDVIMGTGKTTWTINHENEAASCGPHLFPERVFTLIFG